MNRDPSRTTGNSSRGRRAVSLAAGVLIVGTALAGCDPGKARANNPPAPASQPGFSGSTKAASNYRTSPVVLEDGSNICFVAEEQEPITALDSVETVDGLATNPNDPNGKWLKLPLGQTSENVQEACADIAEGGVVYTAETNIIRNN